MANNHCSAKVITKSLKNLPSYLEFRPDLLPQGISAEEVLKALEFVSPKLVILHGSFASGTRFSSKKKSDLDLVCVSSKAAFWSIEQLLKTFQQKYGEHSTKIDLTMISTTSFLSLLDSDSSSLKKSFNHGFSILYEEKR